MAEPVQGNELQACQPEILFLNHEEPVSKKAATRKFGLRLLVLKKEFLFRDKLSFHHGIVAGKTAYKIIGAFRRCREFNGSRFTSTN